MLLYLAQTHFVDLSPISALTQLNALSLDQTYVVDLSPLKHLKNLTVFTDDKEKATQWKAQGFDIGLIPS